MLTLYRRELSWRGRQLHCDVFHSQTHERGLLLPNLHRSSFPDRIFPIAFGLVFGCFFGIFRSYVRGTARLRFVYCTNYIIRLVAFPTFGNSISSGWCVTARRKMWYSLPCRTGCYSDFDIISFRCGMSMLQILISMPIGWCSIRQVS